MEKNCQNSTKKNAVFVCELCDFKCFKNSEWIRHVDTKKHTHRLKGNVQETMEIKKYAEFVCGCGKSYVSNSGLWKHKKICSTINHKLEDSVDKADNAEFKDYTFDKNFKITPEMFYDLLKQNNELQKSLIQLAREKTPTISNNTNCGNNNNNKTFNLQFFLNETCKDALNITDFVNQIQLSISDLEETGKLGYAEGISKVFINNLQDIDLTMRPIHCSDSKRETLYIKDDNQWTKDDAQKSQLTKAIKQVANKNIKQISEWQKLHPEYSDPDSKQNDKYMKIVLNSMSGSTQEEANKNYEKIIKRVIKETIIEK
jgi:hypothetical protein